MGDCSWNLDVQAGMGTPFVGEALCRLSGAGGGKGGGSGLCARCQGQRPRVDFPHAATLGTEIRGFLNSN